MTLYHFPVDKTPEQIAPFLCKETHTIWFDSAKPDHPKNCYSYIAFAPLETYRDISFSRQKEILKGLNFSPNNPDLPPFQGGLSGLWAYDLARDLESIPEKNHKENNIPNVWFGVYDQVYAYDHAQNKGWYMCHCTDKKIAAQKFELFLKKINQPAAFISPLQNLEWSCDFIRNEYEQAVATVINHILEGDIFQANLSRKYQAICPADFQSFDHYLYVRKSNPAPFSAYMNMDGFEILSTSPESFLKVSSSGHVQSSPIKGTSHDAEELKCSQKDHAENVMIVDLLRNDLSKICEDHSINVTDLCRLEKFEGLYHLVSDIHGTLKRELSALDALEACFPGGSITGAPKIESMKVIESLERSRRGIYCGAIGWMGSNGAMETNIAIRTMIKQDDTIWFNVGGGITANSDPAREYDETCLKAKKILEILGGIE
ncbi:MAG: anthranilate synthase component I family protein [Alphaproteobacteria bacterium]|jgi:para-aminobenzoate synthetase component 1|nr:anthranilate synthase component I family protein [Alphaproteobacteria bacterium]